MRDLLTERGIDVHPLAATFPIMQGDDWTEFQANVGAYGIQQPIVYTSDGTLVDGRNRLTAWLSLGREATSAPSITLTDDADADDFIISANVRRRQMNPSQKALAAARSLPYYAGRVGRPSVNQRSSALISGKSSVVAAGKFGVGSRNVEQAKKVLEYPDVAARVESGDWDIARALREIGELRDGEKAAKDPLDLKWRMGEQVIVNVENVSAMRELHRQLTAELARFL